MLSEQQTVSASLEDYLEAIYVTVEAKGAARAKDIVAHMGVHNSSVTQALRALADRKLVNYAPYDLITLTASGERIAVDVLRRHEILREFLIKVLGLPGGEADSAACRMEHTIGPNIMDRLVKFVEYFENCPANDVQWDDRHGFFCRGMREVEGALCHRDTCANYARGRSPDNGDDQQAED